MKNIFSKTTENRTQNGVKSYSFPTRLLYTISIFAFLTLGVGQVWAGTNGNNIAFNNCYFYFNPYYDATHTVNKGYIQLSARKYQYSGGDDYGWWTATTTLSNVANTRLYYASTLEGTAWGDTDKRFHGWAIISNSDKKAASASDEWWNSSTWASDFKAYGLNSNNTYLFQASSSTKGKTIQTTSAPGYLSGGWSDLNKTITVKAKVSTNNGSSYAETTSPAILTASSNKFTAHNTCTTPTSLSSETITCGYTATTTLTAADATGYNFVGWYNSTGTQQTTSKTITIYPTEDATYYAYYKANTYTVTYNANDEQYPGTASGATTSSSHTYGTAKNLTSNGFARAGYIFAGWATTPTGDVEYTNGQSVTNLSSTQGATVTLYAKWTEITLSATISPSTISANTATPIQFTITTNAPLSSNYYFQISNWGDKNSGTAGGYNIDGDHPITLASPFTHDLADGKTNLAAGTYKIKLKITKDAVLHVESELITLVVSSSTYSVTVNAGAGGIVSPTSISASPDSWSGDITATPNAGYRFDNWTSSGGGITIINNKSATTQIKANSTGGTLTANFAAATYRVTLDNQSATTAGTAYVDATYNTTTLTSITKPTKNNYTFGGYYTETGGNGTQIIDADGNWLANKEGFTDSNRKSIITENKTLYAHWTEIKYEVTISVSNPSATRGTIDCSAAGWVTSNHGTAQIGNATEVSMIAGAPASGYTWGSWVLSGGVTLISGNLTDAKIVVKATSAVTATYTYAEDLTTTWYISGNDPGTTAGSPFSGWGTNGTRMYKKAGYSTVEKYYCTITVSTVATSNDHFPFQVFDGTNHRGYNGYWITKENNTQTVYTNNSNNMKFRPYITGDYEFEVDNTGANPVLTVHWPSINQLRVSVASPEDGSNIGNFDLTETSTNNWSVTRTLNANTTYTFKMVFDGAWYGNGTAFTRDNNSAEVLGDGNYMTIQTDVAGEYTFTFNSNSKNLSITYPTAYRVTYGVGTEYTSMGRVSTEPSISSGSYVIEGTEITFTATPNLGYKFVGWYDNAECTGDAVSTDASYTIASLSANTTLYAKFDYRPLYIHADFAPNGWDTPVQMTQSTENRAVYTYEIDPLAAKSGAPASEGHHFHFVNTVENPNGNKAYNYKGVQTPTGSGFLTNENIHLTHEDNATIQFDLTRKSKITITLTLQSIDDNPKPTVNIAADPYYDITYTAPSHGTYTIQVGAAAAVSANTEARANTTITLANTPDTGYHLDSWTVAKSEGNIEVSNNQFMMPAEDVTVSAAFTANTYSITLNAGTGGSGSGTATIDYDATGYTTWSHDITQTGYHIKGWYDNGKKLKVLNVDGTFAASDVTGYITSGKWSKASDCTLQAWWDPNNYTVTLDVDEDHQGTITGATTSHTVTFNTVPNTVPNRPTAEQGYGLDGYYTRQNGEGTKVINGDGTFIASVDGYTDRDAKWIRADGVTLYAYYKKAQITRITFSPGNIVAPGAEVGVTATVEPTPEEPTTICWRVLYSNDNPLDPQPTFTPAEAQGKSVSFIAPEASGSYKVEATLRKGTGCGGEEIHTFTAPFQVAGDHTVTVQYKCGDVTLQGSTSVTARPLDWSTEITPDEIFGYSFEKWVAGDGVTMTIDGGETTINTGGETTGKDGTHAVQIKAIYDGKLIAQYTKKNIIYFKNTLGWSEVYVNLYPHAWWNSSMGAGNETLANDKRNKQMTQLGETDIWYYEYGNTATTAYVSFTDRSQNNYTGFAGTSSVNKVQVSYPTRPYATEDEDANYGFNAGTPMFVPTAGQTAQPWNKSGNDDLAEYYNKGYWRKYDPIQGETGYTLKVYNMTEDNGRTELKSIKFVESDVPGQLFKAVANLEAAGGYGIKFERDNSMLYTNISGHLQSTGDVVVTEKQDANYRAIWIKATAAGDYTFAITINGDGKLCIQAEFPVAKDDYRVIYTDNATWTKAHTAHTWIHPSRIISAEENAVDTISFFVSKGHSPEFRIQKVNTINEGTGAIEWTNVTDWTSCDDVDASGVYNFIFTQDGSKNIRFTKKEPYTGNFYIRTDAAGSTKWDNYRAPDHLMTYSEYSKDHSDYTHYFVKFVGKSKNVKFVVANDYSPCISDTLIRQTYRGGDSDHIDENGFLNGDLPGDGVNVRYMWDIRNNAVYRAYLAPAQSDGSNFLVLRGTDSDNLKDENGNPLRNASNSGQDGYNHKAPDYCIQFVDNENWIYEATVQVVPSSYVKLYAFFHGDNFYYKGTEDDTFDDTHAIKLVEGSGNAVKVRVIYDFKTDRLVAAYLPSGNIDEEMAINADVMFIREHQGDIEQLTFTGDGAITEIKTAYAVMRFNKWTLNNKEKTGSNNPLASSPASIYERSLYYVSFPFPVNLNEVFGFGTYGQHWIIQRYRGDLRAQQGFWAESDGFWEFIWNRNGVVLQPNEGYILTLETELLGEESDVWGPDHRSNQIELFFPSSGPLESITNASVTQELPKHTCTIDKTKDQFGNPTGLQDSSDPSTSYNRTVFDSHWNIMSVPTYVNVDNPNFANTTWIANESCPRFLYTWNMNDNTLTATSGKGFMYHAMHAYTVQYYGDVTWTTSVTPTAAPQRNTEYRGEYEFCLEVQQDDQMIDRTYVRLSDDENVTTGFEFSEDMTKQFNSRKANIFTIAGNTSLGGNSLPLSTTQTTVVPVGVKIKTAGDYTFSIPEGTEGIGVTLVDNETGVRTLLSALDYTVNLTAGTHDGRFVLEISPIYNTPTGIEEPTSDSSLKGRAQKRIIDGVLYIVKDGKIFDARGTRVE